MAKLEIYNGNLSKYFPFLLKDFENIYLVVNSKAPSQKQLLTNKTIRSLRDLSKTLVVIDQKKLPELKDVNFNDTAETVIIYCKAKEHFCKDLPTLTQLKHACLYLPESLSHYQKFPIFLISIPKSGTHLMFKLAKLLGYVEGFDNKYKAGHSYTLEFTNAHTRVKDFFVDSVRRSPFGNRNHPFLYSPALFQYRNPLDILLSEANYYHQAGKSPFFQYLSEMTLTERIGKLINDPLILGNLDERINGFYGWTVFNNVIPVSYEELMPEKAGGIPGLAQLSVWSIMLKLGTPGNSEEISQNLFDPNSATFKQGGFGKYHPYISEEQFSALNENAKVCLENFGYEHLLNKKYNNFIKTKDQNDYLSAKITQYRERELKLYPQSEPTDFLVEKIGRVNIVNRDNKYLAFEEGSPSAKYISDDLNHIKALVIENYKPVDKAMFLIAKGKKHNLIEYSGKFYIVAHHLGELNPVTLNDKIDEGNSIIPINNAENAKALIAYLDEQ